MFATRDYGKFNIDIVDYLLILRENFEVERIFAVIKLPFSSRLCGDVFRRVPFSVFRSAERVGSNATQL